MKGMIHIIAPSYWAWREEYRRLLAKKRDRYTGRITKIYGTVSLAHKILIELRARRRARREMDGTYHGGRWHELRIGG